MGQKFKVLIVEDNAFNIVPIKTTLEKKQIEYDIAKNGLMAVDRYNHIMKEGYLYDFIFLQLHVRNHIDGSGNAGNGWL